MINSFKNIIHFAVFFAKKDLKVRFAGSLLGILWLFIQPACLIIIYFFVFSIILKIKISLSNGVNSFLPFLLTGLFPWLAFQEGCIKAATSIIENAEAVKKIYFPLEGVPLGVIISTYCIHGIAFLFFLLGYIIYLSFKGVPIPLLIGLIPFYLFILFLATIGFGLLLAAISTYFRDVIQIFNLIFQVWFYGTPIVYPLSMVPKKLQFVIKWNPITGIIESCREILFLNKLPLEIYQLWGLVAACLCLIIGIFVFKKLKIGFADIL